MTTIFECAKCGKSARIVSSRAYHAGQRVSFVVECHGRYDNVRVSTLEITRLQQGHTLRLTAFAWECPGPEPFLPGLCEFLP